jgi:hypothetical protein
MTGTETNGLAVECQLLAVGYLLEGTGRARVKGQGPALGNSKGTGWPTPPQEGGERYSSNVTEATGKSAIATSVDVTIIITIPIL